MDENNEVARSEARSEKVAADELVEGEAFLWYVIKHVMPATAMHTLQCGPECSDPKNEDSQLSVC